MELRKRQTLTYVSCCQGCRLSEVQLRLCKSIFVSFLPGDAMQAQPSRHAVSVCLSLRLSVCPSICHVRELCQNE